MKYCFKVGLYKQGLLHDLSKYSPTEFLVGAKYYQGTRSPNNAEREATGVSTSWLHHKGRNKHHFEYWVDYGIGAEHVLAGMPMPRKYLEYFMKGKDRLWFIHPDTSAQIEYLLRMLAVKGEKKTLWYIKHVYLKNKGRFGGSGSTYISPKRRVHS